ncbi:MAG TPA: 16S rRNA (cytosine(967)-C(5))-methyltransferase RsmB [Solirubrobacteraceae bacterium]|jgi:16S rRNA (cytosine967-C5)-methyltransferase
MSAPAPARACAYLVLRRVFERGAYADIALRTNATALDSRDRALAMRLIYGTVQRRGTLDYVIERLAGRAPERLDAPLLAALRLGCYELLYLRGAPDHAVVADAVELAKGASRGHGLVNAVLRRAAREGPALLAELRDDTPERAAVAHSHPLWIARLWWRELGADDARALLAFDNEPAELALRANTLLSDPATLTRELASGDPPVSTRIDPRIPEALVVEGPVDLPRLPQWRSGALLAQSRGAMLPPRALAPRPGERVLDLCAAPGGKSTHLAALMENQGEVLAVERNPRRAADLQQTVRRLHASCVRVVLADATQPLAGEGQFDRVLVDPPCSGLGTLQARADLRWRITEQQVPELARTQAAILAAGAAAVRPGGVLVYSTCTISPQENERQIFNFMESNADFSLDDLWGDNDRSDAPALGTPVMDGRAVLTLPHRDRTAGFFLARLRRR